MLLAQKTLPSWTAVIGLRAEGIEMVQALLRLEVDVYSFSNQKKSKLIGRTQSIARIGVVQWQMRRFLSFDDFLQQVEFFVDTVSDYQSDIVLFPELFNAPLIHTSEDRNPAMAMRELAEHTEALRQAMVEMALGYTISILLPAVCRSFGMMGNCTTSATFAGGMEPGTISQSCISPQTRINTGALPAATI